MTAAPAEQLERRPCDRYVRGTYRRNTGRAWWAVQYIRCAWCKGTGFVFADHQADDVDEQILEALERCASGIADTRARILERGVVPAGA